jgi:putative ABC transport system permease protein
VEKLNKNDIRIIENVNGVEFVIPRLIRVGRLEYNDVSGFGYGVSIPEDPEMIEIIYDAMGFKEGVGRLLEEGDSGKVLLGDMFRTTEDFGKELRIGKKVIIEGEKKRSYEIIGFVKKTSNFQLNGMVFMMEEDMNDVFGIDNEIDMIIAQVEDKDRIEDVSEEIKRKLRNDRNENLGEESFTVETPLEALDSVNNIMDIINLIVIGIAMISLFVGGIGIANTMYTSVVERRREIGIMKAVGARNKDILMIFLIESGLLGLVGGLVGAGIGLGLAFGASALASQAMGIDLFQVAISYPLLIGAVGFSFFVGIISGVVPAFQASKLNVVEALRG